MLLGDIAAGIEVKNIREWLYPNREEVRELLLKCCTLNVVPVLIATVLPARVTDRIARGVVCVKEGAWFTPDDQGRDTRGCANVLTADRSAPSGASTYNTCQVDVEPLR